MPRVEHGLKDNGNEEQVQNIRKDFNTWIVIASRLVQGFHAS